MPTYTHQAQVMFTARCGTHGCTFDETYLHADEAADAVVDHMAAHELRHTCRYDERAGWLGVDECVGCRYETRKRTA